jgi:hypothetical protein
MAAAERKRRGSSDSITVRFIGIPDLEGTGQKKRKSIVSHVTRYGRHGATNRGISITPARQRGAAENTKNIAFL